MRLVCKMLLPITLFTYTNTMQAKHLHSIIFCLLFGILASCEGFEILRLNSEKNPVVGFKIANLSKTNFNSVKLYMRDINYPKIYRDTLIYSTEKLLKINDSISLFKRDLRNYTKAYHGEFYVVAKKENTIDTVFQQFGSFTDYNVSGEFYAGYNTYEIQLIDKGTLPTPKENKEVMVYFARYKGNKRVEIREAPTTEF